VQQYSHYKREHVKAERNPEILPNFGVLFFKLLVGNSTVCNFAGYSCGGEGRATERGVARGAETTGRTATEAP